MYWDDEKDQLSSERWLLVEFTNTNQRVERGVNSGRKLPQIVTIKISQ